MRAALYARVSTERQADRGTIGSQVQLLRQHIAEVGDELVGEYVDDGHSGARLDRPGLDALRDAAEAGLARSPRVLRVSRSSAPSTRTKSGSSASNPATAPAASPASPRQQARLLRAVRVSRSSGPRVVVKAGSQLSQRSRLSAGRGVLRDCRNRIAASGSPAARWHCQVEQSDRDLRRCVLVNPPGHM